MPGPDPNAMWFEKEDGAIRATYEAYFWTGKSWNRQKRVNRILYRMYKMDWQCDWCREELPHWRRADAQYCCEGCRKRAAYHRRMKHG